MAWAKLYVGDALKVMKTLKSESVDMCMTSPPYWGLRDYGVENQIGLEPTSDDYIRRLSEYLHELRRVLKSAGSLYLNLGDTYMKKNLQMIPSRVALALQKDGWILRNDIIWHKPNHMPASVKDRLTNTYEHLFHFVKSRRYYYDLDSIRIPHKTGPASFNYRVREAKRGRLGIVGVKSNTREMAGYDNKGQKVRGLKTKGKSQIGKEQHHGKDINYHPRGKNPGDVAAYNTKFNKGCQASNLLARTAYARKVLCGDHETALNHPLGKNPGDVMGLPGITKSQQLFLDTRGKIGHGHYKGGIYFGVRSHPLGKNPGDVVFTANTGLENKEPYKLNNPHRLRLQGNRYCTHPMGKNPGDVVALKYKGRAQLRQDTNLGGKVGLAEFREWCRVNGIPEGHAFGKNPGDVMNLVSETRSKDRLLSQRRRDLAEMRSEGRIHWELHPSKDPRWFNSKGKNPTDFWEIRPRPFPGAHFAVYPETLCIMPITSSCPPGGVVLDPFAGSGTTMKVAFSLGRSAIGIDINPEYVALIKQRIPQLRAEDVAYLVKAIASHPVSRTSTTTEASVV